VNSLTSPSDSIKSLAESSTSVQEADIFYELARLEGLFVADFVEDSSRFFLFFSLREYYFIWVFFVVTYFA
jgi:hypothetical protein